jgi:hypothetical protein
MSTITFSNEDFPSLADNEYLSEWNQIGFSDLREGEQALLQQFLAYTDIAEIDFENLLLVKAADGGFFKNVYGPSVFQREGGLIVKVGGNELPMAEEKDAKGAINLFRIGTLTGTIAFADEPIEIDLDVVDPITNKKTGEKAKINYFPARIDFMPEDGTEIEYRIRVSFQITTEPSPSKVRAAMKRGDSIAKFLREPGQGGGGGDAGKMQELGNGEFPVESYRAVETNQYGTRYIIKLVDGREVWSRGNCDMQLKDELSRSSVDRALAEGKPVTLTTANIKIGSDGKCRMDCALRLRAPRSADDSLGEAKKPNVTPVRELAAAGSGKASKDNIPF